MVQAISAQKCFRCSNILNHAISYYFLLLGSLSQVTSMYRSFLKPAAQQPVIWNQPGACVVLKAPPTWGLKWKLTEAPSCSILLDSVGTRRCGWVKTVPMPTSCIYNVWMQSYQQNRSTLLHSQLYRPIKVITYSLLFTPWQYHCFILFLICWIASVV